jgi:hypothetical protein
MVSLHEHQKGCSDSHCICFQPQSADLWLRIPSIVMLHYLRCSPNLPNSDNIWLDRIREVIRNSSKETRNNMETVWGLTVEKEYNWPKVLSITLLGLTLSTLVAFSWAAVAKSDTQEAFPVTLCIVLVTMVLSSLIATPDSRKADADFGTINKTSNDNFITTWKLSEPVGQTLHAQTKQSRSQRMSRYSISTFLLSIPEVWSRHLVRFGLGEEPIPQGKQRIRWHCVSIPT